MEIEIRLFGAFRNFSPGTDRVRVTVPAGAGSQELRSALLAALPGEPAREHLRDLIADSAFANESDLLPPDFRVSETSAWKQLAVLPPVCGG
ncbi:MAG: MoaD/ThiS family protein [Bacteriovoracia bacterium]